MSAEGELRNAELGAFAVEYREALKEFFEGAEDDEFFDEPVSPDPFSLGVSDLTPEEMEPDYLGVVGSELRRALGINPLDPDTEVRRYVIEAPDTAESPGEITVVVLNTMYKGIGLHEMRFQDNQVRWTVGKSNVNME